MTSSSSGGGDKPSPPPSPPPELQDDPLQYPASDAGWGDAPPPPPVPTGTTTSGGAAATVEVAASLIEPAASKTTVAKTTVPEPVAPKPASSTSNTPPSSISKAPPGPPGEEPLLPATYHENDLRSAVGASPLSEPTTATTRKRRAPASDPRHDDDDDDDSPHQPRNRKAIVVSALGITAGLAVAGLVFLGHANSDRYLLTCEAERAVPEQGRSFPPWGTRALEGEAWKPLKIAPEARCQPHETDDPLDLERLYLSMILDQATAQLTAREVTKIDDIEALLKQALLLTRPPEHEPENLANARNEHHQEIERMLGDVMYWRASAKVREAAAALTDAAKQFESAAAQHPRHALDAPAWATYARKLGQELLRTGPAGATPSPALSTPSAAPSAASPAVPTTAHSNVPIGVALPVEPTKGSADEPPPAPAALDAGVPTGGVLL